MPCFVPLTTAKVSDLRMARSIPLPSNSIVVSDRVPLWIGVQKEVLPSNPSKTYIGSTGTGKERKQTFDTNGRVVYTVSAGR